MKRQLKSGILWAVTVLTAGLFMTAQAAGIKADAVNELTPDTGVTLDGVAARDGHVALPEITAPADTAGKLYNESGTLHWNGAQLGPALGIPKISEAYVAVEVSANAATNGTNLRNAYTAAKAKTPHGAALSAENRAVVFVPPGNYDLGASTLELDTDYVDLAGLSTDREEQRIYSASGNVLTQTAADLHIENLLLHYTGTSGTVYAYYPNATWNDGEDHTGSPPETAIRNCEFRVNSTSYRSMRHGVEYAGVYEDCLASGEYAFGGGSGGVASGTFTNCTGANYAFGGDNGGTASGTFTSCTGANYAFGGNGGTAGGTFTNCTGSYAAFGSGSTAGGTFTNCTGGGYSFGETAGGTFTNCTGGECAFGGGGTGTAGGTFNNCTGENGAFGGWGGTASGTFTNCTGALGAFGGDGGGAAGGEFYYCNGGADSFTTTGAPIVLYCVRNGAAYPPASPT